MSFDLWDSLDELLENKSELDTFRLGLETVVEAVESVCRGQGTSVYGLAKPSKLSFFWMKFLLLENNLEDHVNALRIARYTALEEGLAVEVHLVNDPKRAYKLTREPDQLLIKAHEYFIRADKNVWRSFMKSAKDGNLEAKQVVSAFLKSAQCAKVYQDLIKLMCSCGERHEH